MENGSTSLGSSGWGAMIKRESLVAAGCGAVGALIWGTAGVLFGAGTNSGAVRIELSGTIGVLCGSKLGRTKGVSSVGLILLGMGAVWGAVWATCGLVGAGIGCCGSRSAAVSGSSGLVVVAS